MVDNKGGPDVTPKVFNKAYTELPQSTRGGLKSLEKYIENRSTDL